MDGRSQSQEAITVYLAILMEFFFVVSLRTMRVTGAYAREQSPLRRREQSQIAVHFA